MSKTKCHSKAISLAVALVMILGLVLVLAVQSPLRASDQVQASIITTIDGVSKTNTCARGLGLS